jgi:GT2 family glycosyltransferase
MGDLDIIVVSWNTRDILRDCLASVYEQTRGISFQVIVVDNASSDGSAEMVRAEFPQAVLIENTENRGFAAANNQGMEIAGGRYVLLLNSDTIVLDGAIQKTLRFAESHPEAAVVGCRVLNPDGTLQRTCFMFPSLLNLVLAATYLYKIAPRNSFCGRERMGGWERDAVREVEVVSGCFMLVRREAIERVGLMDEEYFMYAEETDWCWRFKKAGWKSLFYPDAQIVHLGGQSSRQVRIKSLIQLRLGLLQFMFKNRSSLVFRCAGLLIALFLWLRVSFWLAMRIVRPMDPNARNYLRVCIQGAYRVLRATIVPTADNFRA